MSLTFLAVSASLAQIFALIIAICSTIWKRWIKITVLVLVTFGIISSQYFILKATSYKQPTPNITIIDDIRDEQNNVIQRTASPFKILVRGTVSHANNLFVYLVVCDFSAEWIEPVECLGANIDKDFSGYCYLGIIDDPNSMNKLYKVFAVVTDREYKSYEHLDRKTIKAESNKLDVYRTHL